MTYAQAVKEVYDELKRERKLPLRLTNPKRGNIKDHLIFIIDNHYKESDKKFYTEFLGVYNNLEELKRKVKKLKTDSLRPISNFLNNNTQNPEDLVIELLAVLINFQPRPQNYQVHSYESICKKLLDKIKIGEYKIYENTNTDSSINKSKSKDQKEQTSSTSSVIITAGTVHLTGTLIEKLPPLESEINNKKRRSTSSHILRIGQWSIIPTLLTVYLFFNSSNGSNIMGSIGLQPSSNQCMYWDENKFIPVSCDEKRGTNLILAMDPFVLEKFQKITEIDTISNRSIGKVYYAKQNGVVEFFTAPGFHPENQKTQLRPMSKYMWEKYIKNRK